MKRLIIAVLLLFAIATPAFALTPIAHTDVVPYQRIEYGTSFKFGVVAFSKAGIEKVDFVISGQGYSSGTKTSTSMALNTRVASTSPGAEYSGVYEYYVTIPSSEFTSNGTITVTPTVTGDDAGTKELAEVTLYVEGASDEEQTEAWVDIDGSDGTGTLNNSGDPYPSIATALADIESEDGECSYATVYLVEDVYDVSTGTAGTTDSTGWLTIAAASGADIDNVIIDEDSTLWNTTHIKFSSVTLKSSGSNDAAVDQSGAWLDGCKIVGPGRTTAMTCNPAKNTNGYTTGCYITEVDFGFWVNVLLARGNSIYKISNDLAQNLTGALINTRLDDIDPTGTDAFDCNGAGEQCHADVFQTWGNGPDNRIVYNLVATDANYQGIFMRATNSDGSNVAIVNTFIELRSYTGGGYNGIYGNWDHLLLWHNTFVGQGDPSHWGWSSLLIDDEPTLTPSESMDDCSFIGNVFHQFVWGSGTTESDLAYENDDGNDVSYNHFELVNDIVDTNSPTTRTTGDDIVDISTPGSATFGYPADEASIIDRLPSNLTGVPCDAYGDPRDATPDVGAFEIQGEETPAETPTINGCTVTGMR
jgi:hypothetical protein